MKEDTKTQQNKVIEFGKGLQRLGKKLQKLGEEGCPVKFDYQMVSIGLAENPLREYYYIPEYIDLEWREIEIKIHIPNKSIGTKLAELAKQEEEER